MRAFTEPLQELEEFQKIQQALKKQSIQVTGCIDAQKAHFIYAAGAAKKKLIVTYSELRAKELCENYRLFDKNVLFYPAKDLIFYSADVQSNLLVQQRIRVLQKLMEEEEVTIVTTMGGIMDHLLPPEVFQKQVETVESDSEFDMELWKKKLTAMGYERVGQVEGSGQFAVTPSAVLMWKASVPLKIWTESAFIRRANLLLMTGGSKKGLRCWKKRRKGLQISSFRNGKQKNRHA